MNIIPIETNNQRVLLTSQLAEEYGTTPEVISNNFTRNCERYQPGTHYYRLEGDDLRQFKANHQIDDQLKFATKLYLWTEKGALLHAKSLGTDRAWEVYGELVDVYFRARESRLNLQNLSPQLQLLISIETEQRRQAAELQAANERIDGIKDIVALDTRSWRDDARKLIVRTAQAMGGNDYIRDIQAEVFKLVDMRGGVSLETRLTNKRRRMADEGVCPSRREKLNKVDVIADDKKLIEIYVAIVKEMAVKYGVK